MVVLNDWLLRGWLSPHQGNESPTPGFVFVPTRMARQRFVLPQHVGYPVPKNHGAESRQREPVLWNCHETEVDQQLSKIVGVA